MKAATLILPMAGSGSRFQSQGITTPKPLIDLDGAPFVAWALAGLRASLPYGDVVCVVTREQVERTRIDEALRSVIPQARVMILEQGTSGAAETAYQGALRAGLYDDRDAAPMLIVDCDVCVVAPDLEIAIQKARYLGGGILTTFPGQGNPAYSYARYDTDHRLVGTVEKRAVSDHALAGCYGFATPNTFARSYEAYVKNCPYDETYVSGIYAHMLSEGEPVQVVGSLSHFSFGTPDELNRLDRGALKRALGRHCPNRDEDPTWTSR